MKSVAGGVAHKATIRHPPKALGSYFQAAHGSLTIRAKREPTDRSSKGLQWQKDLYCYADRLYNDRDPYWIKLWAEYYMGEKAAKSTIIMGGPKHIKTYEFNAKKDIGRHSTWIRTILTDILDDFNDKYIEAFWKITNLKLEECILTFNALLTNKTEDEISLLYFDINLLRMAGRI